MHKEIKWNWSIPNDTLAFEGLIFFHKQPSCSGFNVKNGLKVKQLAKQPPTLITLMQKNLVEF